MDASEALKNCRVYVWRKPVAIITSKKAYSNAFATITDKKEITVIVDQEKCPVEDAIKVDKDWRILTFDVVLPFGMVGFIAKVSNALAEAGISIYVISAYSTDHVLIKEKNLKKAEEVLRTLGCIIEEK